MRRILDVLQGRTTLPVTVIARTATEEQVIATTTASEQSGVVVSQNPQLYFSKLQTDHIAYLLSLDTTTTHNRPENIAQFNEENQNTGVTWFPNDLEASYAISLIADAHFEKFKNLISLIDLAKQSEALLKLLTAALHGLYHTYLNIIKQWQKTDYTYTRSNLDQFNRGFKRILDYKIKIQNGNVTTEVTAIDLAVSKGNLQFFIDLMQLINTIIENVIPLHMRNRYGRLTEDPINDLISAHELHLCNYHHIVSNSDVYLSVLKYGQPHILFWIMQNSIHYTIDEIDAYSRQHYNQELFLDISRSLINLYNQHDPSKTTQKNNAFSVKEYIDEQVNNKELLNRVTGTIIAILFQFDELSDARSLHRGRVAIDLLLSTPCLTYSFENMFLDIFTAIQSRYEKYPIVQLKLIQYLFESVQKKQSPEFLQKNITLESSCNILKKLLRYTKELSAETLSLYQVCMNLLFTFSQDEKFSYKISELLNEARLGIFEPCKLFLASPLLWQWFERQMQSVSEQNPQSEDLELIKSNYLEAVASKGLELFVTTIVEMHEKNKKNKTAAEEYSFVGEREDFFANAILGACENGHLRVCQFLLEKIKDYNRLSDWFNGVRTRIAEEYALGPLAMLRYLAIARAHRHAAIVEYLKKYASANDINKNKDRLQSYMWVILDIGFVDQILYCLHEHTILLGDTLRWRAINNNETLNICSELFKLHCYLLKNVSAEFNQNQIDPKWCDLIINHIGDSDLIRQYLIEILSQQFNLDETRLNNFMQALFKSILDSSKLAQEKFDERYIEIVHITANKYPDEARHVYVTLLTNIVTFMTGKDKFEQQKIENDQRKVIADFTKKNAIYAPQLLTALFRPSACSIPNVQVVQIDEGGNTNDKESMRTYTETVQEKQQIRRQR